MTPPCTIPRAESPGRTYAVVFTTYGWDPFIEQQFERNAGRVRSGDMHVVVDESHGVVEIPARCVKTVASEAAASRLGLRIAYHRALFWHNIDYLYYIFVDRFPAYDYYVFLDYDAVLNTDADALIEAIAARGVDYVGAPVQDTLNEWPYTAQHRSTYELDVLDARISAVTVLSKAALAHLFLRRRQMSAAPTGGQQAFWPFCEAFVPTELKLGGFRAAGLDEFGNIDRFAWWPPTLDTSLPDVRQAGFVHPVLDRRRFILSMVKYSRTRDFLRPKGRLWQAVRSCRDPRWIWPFVSELGSRLLRKTVARKEIRRPAVSVGMHWNEARTTPQGIWHRTRSLAD